MINYPVCRMSLGDFEVRISTATGKFKGCNDAHFPRAPKNLPVWYRMKEGNMEVDARIGTRRQNIKGPRIKMMMMIKGM